MSPMSPAVSLAFLGCFIHVKAGNYDGDFGFDESYRDDFDDSWPFFGAGIAGIPQGGAGLLQGRFRGDNYEAGLLGSGLGRGFGFADTDDDYFDRMMSLFGSGIGGVSRRSYGHHRVPGISGGLLGPSLISPQSGYGRRPFIGGGIGGMARRMSRGYGSQRVISGIGGIGGLRRIFMKTY